MTNLSGLSEKGVRLVATPSSWPIDSDCIPWTPDGVSKLHRLDDSFIGTPDYMGIAYFWAYDYRHYLRDSSPYRRRLVHKHLILAGLSPDGNTKEHEAIVKRYARPKD
jgi:hypothetical protein